MSGYSKEINNKAQLNTRTQQTNTTMYNNAIVNKQETRKLLEK